MRNPFKAAPQPGIAECMASDIEREVQIQNARDQQRVEDWRAAEALGRAQALLARLKR